MEVSWQVVSPTGPAVAYHAACVINEVMFIHGGINKKGSTTPLNRIYMLDLSGLIWNEVYTEKSPTLSHHSGVVLENRYWLLVGGWDGKVRTPKVFVYDTVKKTWLFPLTSGFEEGAGLSSHTVGMLHNGDIIVAGREGSTKYHRRSGNAWLLRGNIKQGFVYEKIPLNIDSRSGHSMHFIGNQMILLGGRNDKLIESHKGFKSVHNECSLFTKLISLKEKYEALKKPPCGRKCHIAVGGGGLILVHGGETFDGKIREPVPETFLFSLAENQWYKLENSPRGRQGHTMVATRNRIIFHGGEGAKGLIASDSYELKFS